MRISNYPTDTLTGTEMILASNIEVGTQKYKTVNFTVDTLKTFLVGTEDTNEFTNIVLGGSLIFEGATADAHETTLGVIDPTADRAINLPNVAGTLPVLAAVSATAITSTPEELNKLDGYLGSLTELNYLKELYDTGVTAAEYDILDGVTSTAAEINILDGVTATAAELNYLDITTLGESEASKAVTADANGDIRFKGASDKDVVWDTSVRTLEFDEDAKIRLGINSSNQFDGIEIYKSITGYSYITATNIGGLYIQHTHASSGNIYIQAKDGENSIICSKNGAVSVYYDNAVKLATTTTGINVTGGGSFTGDIDITKAGNAVLTVKATELASGARFNLKSADNDASYITFADADDTTTSQIACHGSAAPGANVPLRKGLVFKTNGTTTALTIDSSQKATFSGSVEIGTLNLNSVALTSGAAELNILDASAGNTAVSSDVAISAGAVTSNNYKISHTLTLAATLADDAEHADVVITSDKVLATSVVIANASIDVHIDVHTVVAGSFKIRITNKSGGTLADDSTMIINYRII